MSLAGCVCLEVGGWRYVIERSDIQKYPGSFLECMLKEEWTNQDTQVISVDRDGKLFKYVSSFLICGQLPRDEKGFINIAPEVLESLKEEADFFGLQDLLKECELFRRTPESEKITSYMTMRTYLTRMKAISSILDDSLDVECTREKTTKLLVALGSIHAPFYLRGCLLGFSDDVLFKQSTFETLLLDELIGAANQSAFGRDLQTVTDVSFRDSFEIVAEDLNCVALDKLAGSIDIAAFAPHLHLSLQAYKLVIYKEGGHFDAHRDTVRGDGHIGTLVVILNSSYTGGELEVTHGGRTEVMTGPYSWVAMYGDCLHKINPVTSGTRVSLIYDIYGTPRSVRDPASHSSIELPVSPNDIFLAAESAKPAPEPVTTRLECDISAEDCTTLCDALDEELQNRDAIIICLQHLYPECQTSPVFLKGADRALYDILTNAIHTNTATATATDTINPEGGSKYAVEVVAATIFRTFETHKKREPFECLTGCLFSPSLLAQTLAAPAKDFDPDSWDTYSDTSNNSAAMNAIAEYDISEGERSVNENSANKQSNMKQTHQTMPSKIVIPTSINADALLDYSPYIALTGNESQAGHAVYIVAGLQVRKK